MSPFLFIFYLNEFIECCNQMDCSGIYINENFPNLMLLMFADDMIEAADTVGRLQNLINALATFCDR
jgi:hypothetical protein